MPKPYQYFSNSFIGGSDSFLDYCPIIKPQNNGNCRDLNNQDTIDLYGEKYCESCRCLEGTYSKIPDSIWHPSCHNISCQIDFAIVYIGNVSIICPFTGGIVKIPGF